MATLEIFIICWWVVWYYFRCNVLRKIIYACFERIEEVASKSFAWFVLFAWFIALRV